MRAFVPIALAACASLAGGCKAPPQSTSEDTHLSETDGAVVAPAQPTVSREREAAEAHKPVLAECRAIAVTGEIRTTGSQNDVDAGRTLRLQEPIASDWLVLAKGAHLVAKDPRTTRETTFDGPGRARICVDHREESWLSDGTFESTAGAGETPGAEEWVDTPFGVVRYGAATLRVRVGSHRASVSVGGGSAFVWAPADVRTALSPSRRGSGKSNEPNDDTWIRVSDGVLELRPRKEHPLADDDVRAAADECLAIARRSGSLSRDLVARAHSDGGGSLADAISDQVATRRRARASCAVATIRLEAVGPARDISALAAEVATADAEWSAPPAPPSP